MIDYEECIRKGVLRKIAPSKEKAQQSIEKAKEFIREAKENLDEGRPNTAVIVGYLAIFNAIRSILFRDGFREKSHACAIRYLEEHYKKEIPRNVINMMDRYRTQRHNTQYDVSYHPTREDAHEMLEFAEETIKLIEEIIK